MAKRKSAEGTKFLRFFGPLLDALRKLGGSGTPDEIIMISTGTFSIEARREATRDGAPPIELIHGEKLVDMLEKLEPGVKPVTTFELDHSFFAEFGSGSVWRPTCNCC